VFALPCQVLDNGDRDGIPNVVVEAMAVGIPVVSTAVSGVPEVIRNGHSGLLVEERNPVTLAAALRRLLASDALRAQLVQNAHQTVSREFDSWANGRRLAALFHARAAYAPGKAAYEHAEAALAALARGRRYARRPSVG
jgi:glycosyltransferase involved in cell wall biosynthesis